MEQNLTVIYITYNFLLVIHYVDVEKINEKK